jgi:uncharacterized cupredoxin-like copper-binding protein
VKLLLAAVLIIVAACTQSASQTTAPTSSGTSASPAASPVGSPAVDAVPLGVKDFSLDPRDLTVNGSTVSLAVTNTGPTVHNVTIRDASGAIVMGTANLREGESETISGPVPAGKYVMFCSLPGHESLGIKGELIVAP